MRFLITTLLVLFLNSTGYPQWINQNSGTSESLEDVEFINRYTGWATGFGTILKTTNGGLNWNYQNHPATNKSLYTIHPVNENVLYCVGWFETILKTTNGGENWIPLRNGPFGEGSSYFACYFINENTGWVSGTGYKVWKTTNGGQTFDSIFISASFIRDMYFKNENDGILCGQGGNVRKTSDGGLNWLGVDIPLGGTLSNFRKISVVNNSICWLAGNDNRLFRSTNFGTNWILLDTISQPIGQAQLYCVRFTNENTGWTGGSYGNLWKSTNGGYNWFQEQTNGDQRYFGSLWFYNDSIGWGVGGAGKIFHTTTGGQTLVSITSNNGTITNQYVLSQNFPNPFNPETNIQFNIPNTSVITLKIYNSLGKEIKTLVNENLLPGSYEYRLNMQDNTSGLYFYTLSANGIPLLTKKMLLVK